MTFDFINPLFYLLMGAAGLSLPILVHLLSRKKYDVVHWGAMQFLELGRNKRRKFRLEQFLLLLLRLLLIALIALALARPWVAGGFLTNLVSTQSRDVVFVIDGSYSMGWEGKVVTPHAAARQWVHKFLEDLNPGDTVSLIDARDRVRLVIESPTRDFSFVKQRVDALPPPAGSSNLAEACAQAVQLLSRSSNLERDVVVLTDGQARGWSADDDSLWTLFDDRLQQPAVRPRVWVVNVVSDTSSEMPNFAVDRLQISRELTVVDSPIRIQTKVLYTGGKEPVHRKVFLEVDGQRLAEKTLNLPLQPGGEASVEFEYRAKSVASHLVSVVLDADNLPGDNRADAAVSAKAPLPVLLVDGDPNLDPTLRETFFAAAALTAASNASPWVRADVVDWDRLDLNVLNRYDVVFLANVPRLSEPQAAALRAYVARGGGLLVALGDKIDQANYHQRFFEDGNDLLPATLISSEEDRAKALKGVRVVADSLVLPWVRPFDAENGVDFIETRFESWWKIKPREPQPPNNDGPNGIGNTNVTVPVVAARLTTNDPLIVTHSYGRGAVLLMAVPLDRDWGTLPTQRDYVPLLHEAIFFLAAQKSGRNVEVGTALLFPVDPEFPVHEYVFEGPGETEFDPEPAGDELRPLVKLTDTRLPGTYTLRPKDNRQTSPAVIRPEHFVVNFDRGESDLTSLDDAAKARLGTNDRMAFINTQDKLKAEMFTDNSRSEFWHILLILYLAILVGEVVMTRRLVRGGHAEIDEPIEETEGRIPEAELVQ